MRFPALALLIGLLLAGCAPPLRGVPGPRPFDPAERSTWLAPARWGLDGELAPPVDRAEIGPRTLYLAFDPIPEAARVFLVITPLERGEATVVVERTSDGSELARVPVEGARPAWIELSREPRLELAIRAEGAMAIATPVHADARARPRLEVTIAPEPAAPIGPEAPVSTEAAR